MFRRLITLVLALVTAVFSWLFYSQYLKWWNCFNELGRCLDEETGVVYHAQSGQVWLLLAGLSFAGAIVFWLRRNG